MEIINIEILPQDHAHHLVLYLKGIHQSHAFLIYHIFSLPHVLPLHRPLHMDGLSKSQKYQNGHQWTNCRMDIPNNVDAQIDPLMYHSIKIMRVFPDLNSIQK